MEKNKFHWMSGNTVYKSSRIHFHLACEWAEAFLCCSTSAPCLSSKTLTTVYVEFYLLNTTQSGQLGTGKSDWPRPPSKLHGCATIRTRALGHYNPRFKYTNWLFCKHRKCILGTSLCLFLILNDLKLVF